MIHPDTCLKFVNDQIGYGVFATAFIPKGSITYVKDSLELEIDPETFKQYPEVLQQTVEKYSYIDENGIRIVSWDFAKYVNHCCHCNTMSTGYGFEIAIRDIKAGEEITDEYGLFNLNEEMQLKCSSNGCRTKVTGNDLDLYFEQWDRQVKEALSCFQNVDQPLLPLLDDQILGQVHTYFDNAKCYKSVLSLKASSIALQI